MSDLSYQTLNAIAAKWVDVVWTVSWQFCVLGLIAYLLHLSLYRAAPNWRYWLWQILAIKLLLMPFWTATAPWKWPSAAVAQESPAVSPASIPAATPQTSSPVSNLTDSPKLARSGPERLSSPANKSVRHTATSGLRDVATVRPIEHRVTPSEKTGPTIRSVANPSSKPADKLASAAGMPHREKAAEPVRNESTVRRVPHPTSTPLAHPEAVAKQTDAQETAPSRTEIASSPAPAKGPKVSWQAWLLVAWAGMVVWLVARIVWQGLSLNQRLRMTTPAQAAVVERVHAAASQLGLQRLPSVQVVDWDVSPFVCGLWKTRLILPRGLAESFTPQQLDLVLLHELAHIRRRDLAWGWIPEVAKLLFFFHPLVHFLCYQVRFERELACDQLALLSSGRDVAAYADTLVRVVGQFSCPDSFHLAAAESPQV